jgi:hypothetical protein
MNSYKLLQETQVYMLVFWEIRELMALPSVIVFKFFNETSSLYKAMRFYILSFFLVRSLGYSALFIVIFKSLAEKRNCSKVMMFGQKEIANT